ncbi:hypothetical protein [Nocardia nova]|uniref:hypothetical protein n=1 Tax=Nocardia nova TaxID=37330 RepID=UPI0012E7B530|nr:hypothetical protein [Nocardia nova]
MKEDAMPLTPNVPPTPWQPEREEDHPWPQKPDGDDTDRDEFEKDKGDSPYNPYPTEPA